MTRVRSCYGQNWEGKVRMYTGKTAEIYHPLNGLVWLNLLEVTLAIVSQMLY
jgi:hypothetical protein